MTERNSTHPYLMQLANNLEFRFLRIITEILPPEITALKCNIPLIKCEQKMRMTPSYSPVCDVAVGPFSFAAGNLRDCYNTIVNLHDIRVFTEELNRRRLTTGNDINLNLNRNPRCLMAIEVENSTAQDVKHLLGSITNCSILAKIGIVVVYDENLRYAERLLQYLSFAKRVEKTEENIFNNVSVVARSSFDRILATRN